MIPKPNYKRRKPPKEIPAWLRKQVNERDKKICQRSGKQGHHIHHIVAAGMGRRRVHAIENSITLNDDSHEWAQQTEEGREWCMNWSRERYGNAVDLIKQYGHKWKDYLRIREEGE